VQRLPIFSPGGRRAGLLEALNVGIRLRRIAVHGFFPIAPLAHFATGAKPVPQHITRVR
jgi:hypothetical protein